MQEIAARDRFVLGQSKDCRSYGPCGMNDGAEVCVVEVEDVGTHSVCKRRVHHIEALFTAQDAGLPGATERTEGGEGHLYGVVTRPTDRACHPIQQRARRFLADCWRGFVG